MECENGTLRQLIKKDITARKELGLNIECVMVCSGNISNVEEFTLDNALQWYERIDNVRIIALIPICIGIYVSSSKKSIKIIYREKFVNLILATQIKLNI